MFNGIMQQYSCSGVSEVGMMSPVAPENLVMFDDF